MGPALRRGRLARLTGRFAAVAALAGLAGLGACGNDGDGSAAAASPPGAVPAPPADGSPPSPPPPSPVSNCGSSSFLFCEDFESLAEGPAASPLWAIQRNVASTATIEATPNAQTAPKLLGNKALHLRTAEDQLGNFAYLVPRQVGPSGGYAPPGNSAFGRVWVWVDAFPTAPEFALFTMVEASGAGDGSLVRPLGGQLITSVNREQALWGVGSDRGPTGNWTDWQPTAPTTNKQWMCLEWQFDASDSIVNVFIDGVAKPELTVSTRRHSLHSGNPDVDFRFPAFNQIRIGWQIHQRGPTPASYDVWFDGIALSTTRIGCG
jgi:hypothetical protein